MVDGGSEDDTVGVYREDFSEAPCLQKLLPFTRPKLKDPRLAAARLHCHQHDGLGLGARDERRAVGARSVCHIEGDIGAA